MTNEITSVNVQFIQQATEIRNYALKNNQGKYIPSLFEIASALQELHNNNNNNMNTQTNNNKVFQWVKQWLPAKNAKSTSQKQEADTTSTQPGTTTSIPATATSSEEAKPQNNSMSITEKMNKLKKQIEAIKMDTVKVEVIDLKQHKHGL